MHGKWLFFDENHRLRPLQKLRFFGIFSKLYFSCLENILFSPQCHETFFFFFALFCRKNKRWKMAIFWQKPWTNPFGEFRFLLLFQNFHFSCLQNILLYPEYHETVFFILFCGKETVLPSPLPRRFVVGTRFGFLHHWKALRRFTFLEEERI